MLAHLKNRVRADQQLNTTSTFESPPPTPPGQQQPSPQPTSSATTIVTNPNISPSPRQHHLFVQPLPTHINMRGVNNRYSAKSISQLTKPLAVSTGSNARMSNHHWNSYSSSQLIDNKDYDLITGHSPDRSLITTKTPYHGHVNHTAKLTSTLLDDCCARLRIPYAVHQIARSLYAQAALRCGQYLRTEQLASASLYAACKVSNHKATILADICHQCNVTPTDVSACYEVILDRLPMCADAQRDVIYID